MSTRCPACGEFIGDNTFGKSAQHRCGATINWNAVELASTDPRDAEIAALTERLRIVEAEREEAQAEVHRLANGGGCNQCNDHIISLDEDLSALRAELERKDAALKEALEFLPTEGEMRDEASLNEGRASRAGIVGVHVRAALQPKEPPCQTA